MTLCMRELQTFWSLQFTIVYGIFFAAKLNSIYTICLNRRIRVLSVTVEIPVIGNIISADKIPSRQISQN